MATIAVSVFTVAHKVGKSPWSKKEIRKITQGLKTKASINPKRPKYIILHGQFTVEEVSRALGNEVSFSTIQVKEEETDRLPFHP